MVSLSRKLDALNVLLYSDLLVRWGQSMLCYTELRYAKLMDGRGPYAKRMVTLHHRQSNANHPTQCSNLGIFAQNSLENQNVRPQHAQTPWTVPFVSKHLFLLVPSSQTDSCGAAQSPSPSKISFKISLPGPFRLPSNSWKPTAELILLSSPPTELVNPPAFILLDGVLLGVPKLP